MKVSLQQSTEIERAIIKPDEPLSPVRWTTTGTGLMTAEDMRQSFFSGNSGRGTRNEV
jgi:hypothetical protein